MSTVYYSAIFFSCPEFVVSLCETSYLTKHETGSTCRIDISVIHQFRATYVLQPLRHNLSLILNKYIVVNIHGAHFNRSLYLHLLED